MCVFANVFLNSSLEETRDMMLHIPPTKNVLRADMHGSDLLHFEAAGVCKIVDASAEFRAS